MHSNSTSAPPPDLRIVLTTALHAHEDHDTQRSQPLIERLRHEEHVINPPIVAPMDENQFVILDGANRCYAFAALGYSHSLVQVVRYETGDVELSTWQHVVCAWDEDKFIQHLRQMPGLRIAEGHHDTAIAQIAFRSGLLVSLHAPAETTHERNAALRTLVSIYQRNAILHRSAAVDPATVWTLFPDPIALVSFPQYEPADILAAAREHAFLPPGVSRHIVHGRAIRVNYPLDLLRDPVPSLAEKNAELRVWMQQKMALRQVRYYAEDTYQFDE